MCYPSGMSKPNQPTLTFPVIETFSQDQAHAAFVRLAVARQKNVRDVDSFIANHQIDSRVAYTNVPLPDGGGTMMVPTVVILSAKPIDVTETPVPAPERPKS